MKIVHLVYLEDFQRGVAFKGLSLRRFVNFVFPSRVIVRGELFATERIKSCSLSASFFVESDSNCFCNFKGERGASARGSTPEWPIFSTSHRQQLKIQTAAFRREEMHLFTQKTQPREGR
jgi:hypothetical protein